MAERVIVSIVEARTRPESVERVARAHLDEWGHLYPDATIDDVVAELTSHVVEPTTPYLRITWFAVLDDCVVGSVSLKGDGELDRIDELRFTGPWLANLWVDVAHRGNGIASTLLGHAMNSAAVLGIERLRLITTDAVAMYARRHWVFDASITVSNHHATVMVTTVEP